MAYTLARLFFTAVIVGCRRVQGDISADALELTSSFTPQLASDSEWTSSANSTVCQWTGITCRSGVWALSLSFRNLSGTIPERLPPNLVALNLSGNQLGGSLPVWAQSNDLVMLDLSINLLTGTLPAWNNMSSMIGLFLDSNKLTGGLPANWSMMSQLQNLAVSNNYLTGSIPAGWQAGGFQALTQLWLLNNTLQGPILLANGTRRPLASTIVLQPGNSQLCGKLGPAFEGAIGIAENGSTYAASLGPCALPGLSRALLAWSRSFTNFAEVARDQQFYGWSEAFAEQPCSWTGIGCEDGLVSIELRDVGLQGMPDGTWDALGAFLWYLALDGASLPHQLPDIWGQAWRQVTFISLSNASLQSTIPAAWGDQGSFPWLSQLWLDNNPQLSGTLPQWDQGGLARLTVLKTNSTGVSGSLPASWSSALPGLQAIESASTRLTGTLPASWQTLAQLQYVILPNNSLQGLLPPWGVGSLPQLITLDLSYNQLEGSIPPLGSNGGMSSAQYVNLSHNKLTGQLPASLNALSQMWTFSASNNSGLCGAISLPGNGDDIPPLGYSLGPCSSSQNATATTAPETSRKPSALAIAAFVICILLAVAAIGLFTGLLVRRRCRQTLLDAGGNVQSRGPAMTLPLGPAIPSSDRGQIGAKSYKRFTEES